MKILTRILYNTRRVRLMPERVTAIIEQEPRPKCYLQEESTFTERGRTYAQVTIQVVEDITPVKTPTDVNRGGS